MTRVTLGRRLLEVLGRPGVQLVVGALTLMLAFPASATGTIGRAIAFGAIGVAVAKYWSRAPAAIRVPSRRLASAFVLAVIAMLGVIAFWDVMMVSPDWQMGDWGPQHAVLAKVMPSLPGLHVPVWNHAVSTGDAPLELYPALTYLFTGHFALATGLADDLPRAFMVVAVLVHLGLALTTTAIAIRVASRPIALVVGMFWLVDGGAISHGGTVGLFHWALLHSAFAHVFSMISALGILAALTRPRIGASVTIWLGTAVATAAHPAALITAAAFAIALAMVALVASDVPPRRALIAIGHLALGVALGAAVWLPASERLLAYGQHFSNELYPTVKLVQTMLLFAMPITSYSLVVYAGYLGILTGMWSRRAEVVFVTVVALVMLVGLADAPYLALGLAPGQTVARLGAIRMMLLARPFVYASCAYALCVLIGRSRVAWRGAPPRARLIGAAVLAVMIGSVARFVPEFWRGETARAVDEAHQFAPDPAGRAALEQWATEQMRGIGPHAWARAMFEEDTHEHMHLTATTGLPTFHLSAIPDLLLRERIENAAPASLKRFDVRWVVGLGHSPTLGDPATERVLGSYHVREVAGWDGQFARIERGAGQVEVVRLDDDAVEIDVAAQAPVLVALGTGFYPRWRARHASGADEPVFALPAIDGGSAHVVSAWVAPGHTVFTCDGPLLSDGHGRWLSLLAALIATAIVIAWSRPAWRGAVLRKLAIGRRRLPRLARTAAELGIPALLAVLMVRGCITARGRTMALLVGSGIRPSATVEARIGTANWQGCGYSPISGSYHCEDIVTVTDATVNLMNDAAPSWPFITPSISVTSETDGVEVRITRSARLSGRYWAGSSFGAAQLAIAGEGGTRNFGPHVALEIADPGEALDVQLTARVPDLATLQLTVVAEDTLEPTRSFLDGPPPAAPAEVAAIGAR